MPKGRVKGDGRGNQGGGRKPGTPNKVTRERRELLNSFLDENWDKFKEDYQNADAATRLKIYMEIIPYTTPKMASVDYVDKTPAKTYKDELDELSGEKTRG